MDPSGQGHWLSRTWKELREARETGSFSDSLFCFYSAWDERREKMLSSKMTTIWHLIYPSVCSTVYLCTLTCTRVCTFTETSDLQICTKKKLRSQHYARYTEKSQCGDPRFPSFVFLQDLFAMWETDLQGEGQATTVWGILNALLGTINSLQSMGYK